MGDEGQCSICFDPLAADVVATPCGHTFHTGCIATWFQGQSSCPLCKRRCTKALTITIKYDPQRLLSEHCERADAGASRVVQRYNATRAHVRCGEVREQLAERNQEGKEHREELGAAREELVIGTLSIYTHTHAHTHTHTHTQTHMHTSIHAHTRTYKHTQTHTHRHTHTHTHRHRHTHTHTDTHKYTCSAVSERQPYSRAGKACTRARSFTAATTGAESSRDEIGPHACFAEYQSAMLAVVGSADAGNTHTHTHTHTHAHIHMRALTHTLTHTLLHTHTHTHTRSYTHTHTHTHSLTHTHTHTHTHTLTHSHTHTHTYTHTHTRSHPRTHTHTHTNTRASIHE
jgi:hypothetical protein